MSCWWSLLDNPAAPRAGYCVRCHTGYAVGPHRCSLLKRIKGWFRQRAAVRAQRRAML